MNRKRIVDAAKKASEEKAVSMLLCKINAKLLKLRGTINDLLDQRDELLAALKGVAGDSIAMRGFHEQFRNEIRAAIANAERRKR